MVLLDNEMSGKGKYKITTEYFIERSREVHGDKYDYSKSVVNGALSYVTIICPIHGEFIQRASLHYNNKEGCSKCRNDMWRKDEKFYIKQALELHQGKYDYSLVEYKTCKEKIKIICPKHGVFEVIAGNHINPLLLRGCSKCKGGIKLTTEEFIKKARQNHGDKFDYSKVNYINTDTKVKIICPIHGEFLQKPSKHLLAIFGCQKCFRESTISLKALLWLDSLNIENLEYEKVIETNIKTIIVDGYDPKTNTVYEYLGDYWHGNPKYYDAKKFNLTMGKTHGELYQDTMNRILFLKEKGYKVIYEWENHREKN